MLARLRDVVAAGALLSRDAGVPARAAQPRFAGPPEYQVPRTTTRATGRRTAHQLQAGIAGAE